MVALSPATWKMARDWNHTRPARVPVAGQGQEATMQVIALIATIIAVILFTLRGVGVEFLF
jgi:hypothetical protein